MADKVEIPTVALTQIIERLTERRISVEKAVTTLGEAPSGLRDVFELCRGFERAFTNIVNESPAANKIKEAFFSEKGLAGNVQKLPLEKVFEIESVKKITRTADGYQPHLVSPERGLRLMAVKAMDQRRARGGRGGGRAHRGGDERQGAPQRARVQERDHAGGGARAGRVEG
ncbi:hypothetical protein MNEG_13674 [Monoraphidium neglectum]|uniref:Uncharacterized protein n=1 Tax=Monoraphidium neglectum TaxID=145388 RepID=A0A0D2LRJ8_9CHLO|nr:hypothetical protein MNEG_13674 [Monoraphidium neglectum]KIY94289.1 hypothetical protein MNEG_13674 [Monoraphidium neglectum]|eukprot:XP_013893309.1 hypothetical protein MNEG_13674 [Monoraphidium neglectum]